PSYLHGHLIVASTQVYPHLWHPQSCIHRIYPLVLHYRVASTMLHPLTRSFFFQVNFRFDPGCITFLLLKCVKESFLNQLSSVSVRGASTAPESPASEHGIRVNICQGEVLSSQMRSQKLKSFCFYLIASHIKY
ncbi:hypothetical protein HID58_042714, partial [Brassica napus]